VTPCPCCDAPCVDFGWLVCCGNPGCPIKTERAENHAASEYAAEPVLRWFDAQEEKAIEVVIQPALF
jgi:hypothetical protein